MKIFKSILRRKYKTLNFIDNPSLNLSQIIECMDKETSRKRPEENYKFVFKRTLKQLKNALKKLVPSKTKKQHLENFYLNYYFKEVSEKEGISLDHY